MSSSADASSATERSSLLGGSAAPVISGANMSAHSHSHSHSHPNSHSHGSACSSSGGNPSSRRSPQSRTFRIETHSPGNMCSVKTYTRDANGGCSPHTSPLPAHARPGLIPSCHASAYGSTGGPANVYDEAALRALVHSRETEAADVSEKVSFAINISLVVNIILFAGKCFAFYLSSSMAVAASVVDSFLDLLVQLIIYLSNEGMTNVSAQDKLDYPAGKSRFEPVGLIACAVLMFLAAIQLIGQSFQGLFEGLTGKGVPETEMDTLTIVLLFAVIGFKTILYLYCRALSYLSPTVETLAFDHRNDVLSNIAAAIAVVLVRISPLLWWSDPLGCILISLYIAHNWYELAMDKVFELVGRSADAEFTSEISSFVEAYHPGVVQLDLVRAYHFGSKYLVEIEIVLPESLSVKEAHDISLPLQQAVERMDRVERAFVHVDYEMRSIDEHDVNAVARAMLAEIEEKKSAGGTPPSAGRVSDLADNMV